MRIVIQTFIIITLTAVVSTIVPKISLPFYESSSCTHPGVLLSDSTFHNKGAGFIVPFQNTSILLTQVEMTVNPSFWMCEVNNYDFYVDCHFTFSNPTTNTLAVTLAFPFSTHDICGDHSEVEIFNIGEGNSSLPYSIAMNYDFFAIGENTLYFKGLPLDCRDHPLLEGANDMATVAPALYAEDFELIAYWEMTFNQGETKDINVNFIHYSGIRCCREHKKHFAFDVTNARFWNAPVEFTGRFIKDLNYESISSSFDIQENNDYFLLTGTDCSQKIEVVLDHSLILFDSRFQEKTISLPQMSTQYEFSIWNHREQYDTVELEAIPSFGVGGMVVGYVSPDKVEIPSYNVAGATLFVSGDKLTVPGKYEVLVTGTSQLDPSAPDTISTITTIKDPLIEVAISPSSAELCIGDCQTFTASTIRNGEILTGSYTWKLDGLTLGTGDTYELCPMVDRTHTLTVADTANFDTDSIRITVGGKTCYDFLEGTFTGLGGSSILVLPGIVEIQGTGTSFTFSSVVSYDSPFILKGLKWVNPNKQTITQFIFVLPSILFPDQYGYPKVVQVCVDGLCDNVEIPAFIF
jgi:hypothetical protein